MRELRSGSVRAEVLQPGNLALLGVLCLMRSQGPHVGENRAALSSSLSWCASDLMTAGWEGSGVSLIAWLRPIDMAGGCSSSQDTVSEVLQ